ncbi:uncharacterized protein PG986_003417 [Apiospora aurea]|uniref:Uncharacterized protein n=1 Tax=Apiospora aurea TaxID=335848 RepID=A0ABR1QSJ0_9PEZI
MPPQARIEPPNQIDSHVYMATEPTAVEPPAVYGVTHLAGTGLMQPLYGVPLGGDQDALEDGQLSGRIVVLGSSGGGAAEPYFDDDNEQQQPQAAKFVAADINIRSCLHCQVVTWLPRARNSYALPGIAGREATSGKR